MTNHSKFAAQPFEYILFFRRFQMANYFSTTKLLLKSLIKKMAESPDPFVKRPQKDFSRKSRKISFQQALDFVISLQGKCLDKELLHFYSHSGQTPSSSAMIQARSKLKLSAFEYLFRAFTDTFKRKPAFRDYLLLGADGSRFSLPQNIKEQISWIKNPNTEQGRNVLSLNGLYHLNSGIFEDVLFQNIHELDENQALVTMIDRSCFSQKFIIAGDRGYECYNTFAHIAERGGYFVIRAKQGKTGILSGLDLPEDEEFDLDVTIILCKKHTQKTKEDPKRYKRIRSGTKFDFFTEEKQEYTMSFRVVKVKISDEVTEILFTNLPKEEVSAEELKEIYHMRWNIETAFLHLKYSLSAMAIHSKKSELTLQELYAKIIAFNFCKVITNEVKVPQKEEWKYEYKLNMTVAMDVCMSFWRSPKETAPPDLEGVLLKYLVPSRTGRSFSRPTNKKTTVSFGHRIA